jgi:hypothetical protein
MPPNLHNITKLLINGFVEIQTEINKPVILPPKTKHKKKLSRSMKIDKYKKDYTFELDIPITLTGKYLNEYITTMNMYATDVVIDSYYKMDYYKYQHKIHQYLSQHGLNRTTQLYGTCWLNVIINSIVFNEQLRGNFLQLLNVYIKNNSKILSIIENIKKTSTTLIKAIDYNEMNVFNHFICILIQVLCETGLRNETTVYDNMMLTNTALHIKKKLSNTKEQNDIERMLNVIGEYTDVAFDTIIHIFNNNIDTYNSHLVHVNTHNNISSYTFNKTQFNKLSIYIYNNKIEIFSDMYNNKYIKNIKVYITPEITQYTENYLTLNTICNIDTLDDVKFIFLYEINNNIPDFITCTVKDKKTTYKLCSAIIRYDMVNINKSHVITGFICNNEYYIHDSVDDAYFQIDWRNCVDDNFKMFNDICKETNTNFKCFPAIYYNTNCNFSYNMDNCLPSRPNKS